MNWVTNVNIVYLYFKETEHSSHLNRVHFALFQAIRSNDLKVEKSSFTFAMAEEFKKRGKGNKQE